MAIEDYERLRGKGRDFRRFLLEAPDLHRLDIRRQAVPARRVKL
jgi:hypothetical protein